MLAKQNKRDIRALSRQMLFALLVALVLTVDTVPGLRAGAIDLLAEERAAAEPVTAERVILVGAAESAEELRLDAGRKVTLTCGEVVQYATTRSGESVQALLARMDASLLPMELVKVDLTDAEIRVEIASSFTYYETVREPSAHGVTYTQTYELPKGEQRLASSGADGMRDVVYEVVYADGQLASRQAVLEENDTSIPAVIEVGTCVKQAQAGDKVVSVVTKDDGSGYLLLKSGDALHFSRAIEVKCTAYTKGYGGVGTRTATGTTVRRGVVAVDKSVIPLGSSLYVDVQGAGVEYGMASAEDTGVRGAKLDLYMDTYNECKQFGVRQAVAYVLD